MGEGSRRVVVTGVSRGLGRALAVEFARQGHDVLGCARSADAIAELATQIGTRHRLCALDVRDATAVGRWLAPLCQERAPDLVVLNAGVANAQAPLWQVPPEEMAAVVDTAVMGSAHVIRAVLPAMAARGRGVLVGVSSGLGRIVARGMAPYCAAKWGLEGLMRALALDLPPGLAAVTLDPGAIDTEMLRRYIGESARQHPPPTTWAATAVPWLLALDGRVNGQALTLHGRATLAARALSRLRRP